MKKMYKIAGVPVCTVIFAVLSVLLTEQLIRNIIYYRIVNICVGTVANIILLVWWILLAIGRFWSVIRYDDNAIQCNDCKWNWDTVRIVAYPIPSKSKRTKYYLVFDNRYLAGEEAREVYDYNYCMELTYNRLNQILQYYHHEIKIIDKSDDTAFTSQLCSGQKLNDLVCRHNQEVQNTMSQNT